VTSVRPPDGTASVNSPPASQSTMGWPDSVDVPSGVAIVVGLLATAAAAIVRQPPWTLGLLPDEPWLWIGPAGLLLAGLGAVVCLAGQQGPRWRPVVALVPPALTVAGTIWIAPAGGFASVPGAMLLQLMAGSALLVAAWVLARRPLGLDPSRTSALLPAVVTLLGVALLLGLAQAVLLDRSGSSTAPSPVSSATSTSRTLGGTPSPSRPGWAPARSVPWRWSTPRRHADTAEPDRRAADPAPQPQA
jgi:hypothetical protein